MKSRWIFTVVIILVLGAVGAYGCSSASSKTPGTIEVSPREWDFGPIPPDSPVRHNFTVRNVGQGVLRILGVTTSCGCTKAEVEKDTLRPGEQTILRVIYDPRVHGGKAGRFFRQVYIRSTDPEQPEVAVDIYVTVEEK